MPVVVARTVDEVVGVLSSTPDALVLAGGTDVMVEINERHRRLEQEATVVAVNRVADLRSWSVDAERSRLRLGAAVTYGELETEPLAALVPALAQAARTVGSPQIRAAATVGGNLVTCSPAGDGLPVFSALDAIVEVTGAGGQRAVPVREFMVGVKRTSLAPGELVTAVTIPLLTGWQGYAKVGVRNAMVIAIAGLCLAVDRPGRNVRVALGSVASTVVRATDAERFAADAVDWDAATVDEGAVARFGELAAAAASPIDDHRATAAYRRHAVAVLARRQLARAFAVTGGQR